MKILRLVSYGFPAGGVETGIISVDSLLKNKGYEIKVISSDFAIDKGLFSDYQFPKIDIHSYRKIFTHLFNIQSFRCVKRALTEFKPDIVHIHTMQELTPSVLFLLRNIPTVVTIHGPEEFIPSMGIWNLAPQDFVNQEYNLQKLTPSGWLHYSYQQYLQRPIYRLGFRNVDQFISVSQYIKEQTQSFLFPNKCVYNGVQLMKYTPIKLNYRLLCLGRLEKVKGFEYVIKAMKFILTEFPQVQLTIIGDGEEKVKLLSLARQLNVDKNITFINWLNQNNLEKYYQLTTIVVMPSIWPEAFGKTGIEAGSVGRPVIGTKVGGIPEWLTDKCNGYLVLPKDEHAIAKSVIKIFKNKQLLLPMSMNARKVSEKFSFDVHIKKIDKVYQRLLTLYPYNN